MNAPHTEGPPLIELAGATRVWGAGVEVGPVDLLLQPGERLALIGPNGAGKSTLLRMAAALLTPTSGEVSIRGHRAGSMQARASLSFVPDHPVLYPDLSVWEQCEYVARLHRMDRWEIPAAQRLERIGLLDRADDLPTSFSRGMRTKTATVMALLRPFDVFVADEPMQGLDVGSQEVVLDMLDEEAARGAALLIATHNLDHLEHFDRMMVIIDGGVTHDGPPDIAVARSAVG